MTRQPAVATGGRQVARRVDTPEPGLRIFYRGVTTELRAYRRAPIQIWSMGSSA